MTYPTSARFGAPQLPADKRYDPGYDPLVANDPGIGRAYAPTYWVATVGPSPADDGPVAHDLDADVVVIGSGSTGLSTALSLAEAHGVHATVLEANQLSWGCSSRSGGQGQNASGRLKRSEWIARWGFDVARRLDAEVRAGFERFKGLTQAIDCDAHDGGHLHIAHRAEKMDALRAEARVMNEQFGYATRLLGLDELRRDWCDEREAAGALYEAEGVGIHPLKFTYGLAERARALGVRLHTSSPVQGWSVRRWCTPPRTLQCCTGLAVCSRTPSARARAASP